MLLGLGDDIGGHVGDVIVRKAAAEGGHGVLAVGHLSHNGLRAKGADAKIAGGRESAGTSASGANARSAGGRASASTSAGGAHARSAGGRDSASTNAN